VAPQTVADDSIRRTAAQLASGPGEGIEKIRAVTRFVQGVRYLNVAMGRSTAEPHPAPQILKNRFGDCEDKSVLTITLLREIGVDAYPVQARTSDIGALEPEFPVPNQFNHAIVAIESPEGVDLPSTIDGGPLGRLIIFDPTDSVSGLGDLDRHLQGTRAVVSHANHGGLVMLPTLSPETNARDIEASVSFAAAGGIDLKAKITYIGQYAAAKRWHYGEVRGDKRKEEISAYLASHYGRAEVKRFDLVGVETPDEPLVLNLDVSMPLPGRDMGTMRTMATQFLLASRAEILSETERRSPLRVQAGYRETDRTTLDVPAGWRALSPLPSVQSTSALGEYRMGARVEGGRLIVERELIVRAGTVGPAAYGPVKKFFDDVARGDASAIAFEAAPR
jgi:transglutaminase superfamily protein